MKEREDLRKVLKDLNEISLEATKFKKVKHFLNNRTMKCQKGWLEQKAKCNIHK